MGFFGFFTQSRETVGASLLAMDVNDNAYLLAKRGALESIASNRASTGCSYRGPHSLN
ncbi:hypothetical protein EMIT0P291_280038 [Pseudomonas sp. IT-P291]